MTFTPRDNSSYNTYMTGGAGSEWCGLYNGIHNQTLSMRYKRLNDYRYAFIGNTVTDTVNTLHVIMHGNSIKVWINGVLVEFKDADPSFDGFSVVGGYLPGTVDMDLHSLKLDGKAIDIANGNLGDLTTNARFGIYGIDESYLTSQQYKSNWSIPAIESQNVLINDDDEYIPENDSFWNGYNDSDIKFNVNSNVIKKVLIGTTSEFNKYNSKIGFHSRYNSQDYFISTLEKTIDCNYLVYYVDADVSKLSNFKDSYQWLRIRNLKNNNDSKLTVGLGLSL